MKDRGLIRHLNAQLHLFVHLISADWCNYWMSSANKFGQKWADFPHLDPKTTKLHWSENGQHCNTLTWCMVHTSRELSVIGHNIDGAVNYHTMSNLSLSFTQFSCSQAFSHNIGINNNTFGQNFHNTIDELRKAVKQLCHLFVMGSSITFQMLKILPLK